MGLPPATTWRDRFDVTAIVLLITGLLVALSVFGFGSANNLLGAGGDWLAGSLLESLGNVTYLFLFGWFVVTAIRFRGAVGWRWYRHVIGWLVLVGCSAILLTWFGSKTGGAMLTGAGGTLGAFLNVMLSERASTGPRVLLVFFLTAISLLLVADRFMVVGFSAISNFIRKSRRLLPKKRRVEVNPFTQRKIMPAKRAPFVIVRQKEAPVISENKTKSPEHNTELPSLALLDEPEPFPYDESDPRLRERAALLEKTFADFGLNVRVVGIHTGPVITQYEVALETGLRLNKVTTLADDLALNLGVPSVRVVAPIPGKNTVGIEVPNEHRAVVRMKELITSAAPMLENARLPLFLGKDTEGQPLVYDLAEMPHLLIAGRTGTGKSVCMNAVILSLLMTRTPDEVRMIMIDPKMLELSEYSKIPHLMHPVVKDMKKAEAILAWAVDKMEERYDILARARVRNLAGYNELTHEEIYRRVNPIDDDERQRLVHPMPSIVIFIDEMNDLMMTMKKEVESHIIRLAQKSRAAGIHLIVATQKPTVDVITGLIKSNLPARICFQVASRIDSRVVLDEMGADKLLGKGDMLFLQPGTSTIIRAQGTYASDREIQRVVGAIEGEPDFVNELVTLKTNDAITNENGSIRDQLRARDELYEQAIEVVVREGRGSVSLLQRALGVGYGRAARMIDFMAEDGIVGGYSGSQAREVLITFEQWSEMRDGDSGNGQVKTAERILDAG